MPDTIPAAGGLQRTNKNEAQLLLSLHPSERERETDRLIKHVSMHTRTHTQKVLVLGRVKTR